MNQIMSLKLYNSNYIYLYLSIYPHRPTNTCRHKYACFLYNLKQSLINYMLNTCVPSSFIKRLWFRIRVCNVFLL